MGGGVDDWSLHSGQSMGDMMGRIVRVRFNEAGCDYNRSKAR